MGADAVGKRIKAADALPVHRRDNVPLLQARFGCRGVLRHAVDVRPGGHAVGEQVLTHVGHRDADIGGGDLAAGHDLLYDAEHRVDRDGEADVVHAGLAAGAGVLGIGDAHDLAVVIEEGAAGVAGVDSAVGLNELHAQIARERDLTVQRTDDSSCQGEGQLAERVADRQNVLAHDQLVRVAEDDGGEALRLDLQHRDIVACIIADECRIIAAAIIGRHGDAVGILHHMVVREDVAVLGDDKAGAGRSRLGLIAEIVGGHRGPDTDGGVHGGGIDLRGAHGRLMRLGAGQLDGALLAGGIGGAQPDGHDQGQSQQHGAEPAQAAAGACLLFVQGLIVLRILHGENPSFLFACLHFTARM